jgi:hypothetical protein
MVLPNSKLVSQLQARVKDGFFVDTAALLVQSIDSYDEYGQPTYSQTEDDFKCNFTEKPSRETWAGFADIEDMSAEVRFVGTKPNKGDRFKLKSMFNRSNYEEQRFTEQEYEIIAIRDRDVFGYVCALKEVQV